ncbi:MAG: hypothetical protein ACOZQL_10695 [Myxococcota bacterium]
MLIVYNREGLHHAGNMRLLPGLNDVNDKDFAEAMKWPAFKALVTEGIIEPLSDKEGKNIDFQKLATKDVLELVKATVSKEMLETMLEGEKREVVVDAIFAQIEAIDPTKKA